MNSYLKCLVIIISAVLVSACGSKVFRADFIEKSNGEHFNGTPGLGTYEPPKSPSGDIIRGYYLTTENHQFINNELMLQPSPPGQLNSGEIDFRSKKITNTPKKISYAWSGKKNGSAQLNCGFGTQQYVAGEFVMPNALMIIFEDNKIFVNNGISASVALGDMPSGEEFRLFVSMRTDSNTYYVSVKSEDTGGYTHSGAIGGQYYTDFEYVRAGCKYTSNATSGSNAYYFDDLEFISK